MHSTIDVSKQRRAIQALSGKWVIVVLTALGEGPQGYSQILDHTMMEQKQLARTLKKMREDGLLRRHVQVVESPLRTRYHLTELGHEVLNVANDLAKLWDSFG